MTRFATAASVLAAGLLSTAGVMHGGQQPPAEPQRPTEVTRFRIGVDAVRIDAVVLDREGRTVPDLTAADFEVRQDGKVQTISFVEYMPVASGPAPAAPPLPADAPATAAAPALVPVQRHDVQRTLAIVVDDLGLSFESFHGMRQALHSFIDRELRPGDLVAVVRTAGAGGGLQPFTADRRVLTRKEFLGVSDPPAMAGPLTPAQALIHAATSPFAANGIALRATTLPGYSTERGTFIRALLHIDARPLTFAPGEGGRNTASVDVLGMVFDQDGTEVRRTTAVQRVGFEVR